MATFYSTSVNGTGVALALNATGPGSPPSSGITYRKDFDTATNSAIVADFTVNSQSFAFVAGTLVKGETPATFNPDGLYFEAKQRAAILLAKAKEVKAGNASFSGEDLADAMAITFHADGLPST